MIILHFFFLFLAYGKQSHLATINSTLIGVHGQNDERLQVICITININGNAYDL